MPVLATSLIGCHKVLDPFAGTGRIHQLDGWRVADKHIGNKAVGAKSAPQFLDLETYGIELQPKWAEMHSRTQTGDATNLPFPDGYFDAICTSPCYGNRMSDTYTDDTVRHTYTAYYGETLHKNNAGRMPFPGRAYETLHFSAWLEAWRVLSDGGRLVLNVKNFIAHHDVIDVTRWHQVTLETIGFREIAHKKVETPGNRHGENGQERIDYESVLIFWKPRTFSSKDVMPT